MKKKLLLLGGNPLNIGFNDWAASRKMGLSIVDWREVLPENFSGTHLKFDIKDQELEKLIDLTEIKFCYSSADIAAQSVVRVNQALGLGGPDLEAVEQCITKTFIMSFWKRAGLLNRFFSVVDENNSDIKSVNDMISEFSYDNGKVVVKPSNGSSSRDVKILDVKNVKNISETLQRIYKKYSVPIILDEYIDGEEFSVEMVVDSHQNVRIWPIGQKIKSQFASSETVSVMVLYNPVMDQKVEQDIADFAIRCVKATNLRCTLIHLELKRSSTGVLEPIEMGCRSTGFVASHLCDLVSDESYLDTYFEILKGECVQEGIASKKQISSIYYFYDFPAGSWLSPNEEDIGNEFVKRGFQTLFTQPPNYAHGEEIKPLNDDVLKTSYRVLTCVRQSTTVEEIRSAELAVAGMSINEVC